MNDRRQTCLIYSKKIQSPRKHITICDCSAIFLNKFFLNSILTWQRSVLLCVYTIWCKKKNSVYNATYIWSMNITKIFDDASMKTVFILMSMILNKIDWNIEFYFICYRMGMINFERICKWSMEIAPIMCLNVSLRLPTTYNKSCSS